MYGEAKIYIHNTEPGQTIEKKREKQKKLGQFTLFLSIFGAISSSVCLGNLIKA